MVIGDLEFFSASEAVTCICKRSLSCISAIKGNVIAFCAKRKFAWRRMTFIKIKDLMA
jgi:hypothetical protein